MSLINATSSLCPVCKRGLPADLVEIDDRVVMRKSCPEHGPFEVLIASDAAWYRRILGFPAALKPPAKAHPVDAGCPFDCGACTSHQQRVYLPVIPITSACNLDCPICYTINRNDDAYHIGDDDFRRLLDRIREADPDLQLINLTGGEPTMHPRLAQLVRRCHEAGIHRVTISTHGLTFLKDPALLSELASLRARMVLSFNSFDEEVNKQMVGAKLYARKLEVLASFAAAGVDTTLLSVVALGVNDAEVGRLLDLALSTDCVRSLELHTMTFTGQGGAAFDQRSRITVPDVLRRIEGGSDGRIRVADFIPSPCAHPMCYQTCYLLETDQGHVPFTRFMSDANQRELLTGNLYLEPGPQMESVISQVIDELWSREVPDAIATTVLARLKRLLRELFPATPLPYHLRQQVAERSAKTIYLHSHMDEWTFDTDRIRQCCVGVPEVDGGNTPTCSYNILYRERDRRFSHRQVPALASMPGGRTWGE